MPNFWVYEYTSSMLQPLVTVVLILRTLPDPSNNMPSLYLVAVIGLVLTSYVVKVCIKARVYGLSVTKLNVGSLQRPAVTSRKVARYMALKVHYPRPPLPHPVGTAHILCGCTPPKVRRRGTNRTKRSRRGGYRGRLSDSQNKRWLSKVGLLQKAYTRT